LVAGDGRLSVQRFDHVGKRNVVDRSTLILVGVGTDITTTTCQEQAAEQNAEGADFDDDCIHERHSGKYSGKNPERNAISVSVLCHFVFKKEGTQSQSNGVVRTSYRNR